MHKASFEHRDESMNPACEEGMASETYLKGMARTISLEGGEGAGQTEETEKEEAGKGTAGTRNSTKGKIKSGLTQGVQGNCEQIHILECRV